jgi:hypothetical protein
MDYLATKNKAAAGTGSDLHADGNNLPGLKSVVTKYKSLHPNDLSLSHSKMRQSMIKRWTSGKGKCRWPPYGSNMDEVFWYQIPNTMGGPSLSWSLDNHIQII